jgi:hypothetical protein
LHCQILQIFLALPKKDKCQIKMHFQGFMHAWVVESIQATVSFKNHSSSPEAPEEVSQTNSTQHSWLNLL